MLFMHPILFQNDLNHIDLQFPLTSHHHQPYVKKLIFLSPPSTQNYSYVSMWFKKKTTYVKYYSAVIAPYVSGLLSR